MTVKKLPPGLLEKRDEFIRLAVDSLVRTGFQKVTREPLDRVAGDMFTAERFAEQIGQVQSFAGKLRDKKLLEVGSGYGLFVSLCNYWNLCDAYGVEPGADAYGEAFNIAQQVLESCGISSDRIRNAPGENLPFEDDSFDVVCSMSVLEHVADPAKVLGEVVRVLKPGGTCVVDFGNYGSWWEGHYGIIFPPHCPKWAFKIIVSALGRDPRYVNTLQFITYGKLLDWLRPFQQRVRVLSTGRDIWEHRVRTLQFSEWASLGKLKRIVRLIHTFGLIDLVIYLGKNLHWETPIILVMKKCR